MAKHDQKQTLWDNFNDFIFINSIFGSKWNGVNRESCVCIMLMLIIIWWDYCIWYTIQYHAVQCNWMATQRHRLSGKKFTIICRRREKERETNSVFLDIFSDHNTFWLKIWAPNKWIFTTFKLLIFKATHFSSFCTVKPKIQSGTEFNMFTT